MATTTGTGAPAVAPTTTETPKKRAETLLDAVGHAVAMGDRVTALSGRWTGQGTVTRVGKGRIAVRRDDGLAAVLRPSSVVVLRRVREQGSSA